RGTDDEEHIVKLDPLNTFVIYDTSVDPQPIMAVRYHELQDVNSDGVVINKYVPETWTDTEHVVYKPTLAEAALTIDYSEPQVTFPVVEYKNNAFRLGDYENVISLIDLYDAAQSDTANYMTDLNDAMLVIKGDIDTLFDDSMLLQGIDPNDEEQMKELAQNKLDMLKEMRSANMLLLKSGSTVTGAQTSVDAEYIHKEYDVNGAEA
ncbi:phage portal protein, partial [Klebsiella pneumoniae]